MAKQVEGPFKWNAVFRTFEYPTTLIFIQFAAIAAMIRPIFELLPSFADDLPQSIWEPGQIFSLLTSSQGLGAMIGAVAASYYLARVRYPIFATVADITSTLGRFIFLWSAHFFAAIVSLAIVAGAVLANGIATQVALQTRLPDSMKGRALSLCTGRSHARLFFGNFVCGQATRTVGHGSTNVSSESIERRQVDLFKESKQLSAYVCAPFFRHADPKSINAILTGIP